MDQIVFVIDLESFLPDVLEDVDDSAIESTLTDVRKALLRILTHGRVIERRRDLSSFGFRFYSCTDYFSLPPQLTGDWHDLSLASWEQLEDRLRERLDSVASAVTRIEPGTLLRGRQSPSSTLIRTLEEVTALYSWDRPALFSPVKSARKSELKFGNSVFVITKLPTNLHDLNTFLGHPEERNVRPKAREVSEAIASKRVRSHFTGELSIAYHLLNVDTDNMDIDIIQLYNKALKDFKGGVLQLSSLVSSPSPSSPVLPSLLVSSSAPPPLLPSSSLLSSHLTEAALPAKLLERNYYGLGEISLQSDKPGLQLEYVASTGLALSGLVTLGVVGVRMFSDVTSWTQMASVWTPGHHEDTRLMSLLSYLDTSSQCLIMEDGEKRVMVMFPHSSFTGIIGILDTIESHFYLKLLSNTFSLPVITNNEEIRSIIDQFAPPKFSPSKNSSLRNIDSLPKWDPSSLESWRVPDVAKNSFVNNVKSVITNDTSQQSEFYKMMMSVRDSYTARAGIRGEAEKVSEGKRIFDKKPSALSNASTVSANSGGKEAKARKSMSRGEMLRSMSGINRSEVKEPEEKKDATEAVLRAEKETLIAAKTESASEFEERIGDQGANTEGLINTLSEILGDITRAPEDVVLAGYSEACISVLLKHLDTSGVSKASLEDVVTSKLLLDPTSVARLAGEDTSLRAAHHKVQVLLRAEVHWLLASQERQTEYEEAMLAHLRQVTLHLGHQVMADFLSSLLTPLYVDRQQELVCLLHDELEQERPPCLLSLFSPARSHAPSSVRSNSSALGSNAPASANSMQPPALKPNSNRSLNLSRSFRIRPKSFDTSATSRQIDLTVGSRRLERKGGKTVTTGRMAATKTRLSAKKKLLASGKSPKKTKQMVKRNLSFGFDDGNKSKSPNVKAAKSPRKAVAVTTPSKSRRVKFTPGKRHRVLCPETPTSKVTRRKSDGNTSVAETPEKAMTMMTPRRQQASLALRRKASFYNTSAVSRNVQRFEDSQNASMILGNTTLDLNNSGDNQLESGLNKSQMLFANIVNRKRKLDDSHGPDKDDAQEGQGQSPLRKVRKKLNTLIDSSERVMESTHLMGQAHSGLTHFPNERLEFSTIPNLRRTPVKNFTTPKKFDATEELFSPSKKVFFNLKPQPPTPKSGTKSAKGILKTPSKSPSLHQSPHRAAIFRTPNKTPSKAVSKLALSPANMSPLATTRTSLTPVKVTPRRDISQTSSRSIRIPKSPKVKNPVKVIEAGPSSPLMEEIMRKSRNITAASTAPLTHGFGTPTKTSVLSSLQELLMSEDSQSPRPPHCQDHFQPPLMSTMTPGAKNKLREPPVSSFNPCHASTEINFKLPSVARSLRKPPETESPMITTQDILNSTSLTNLSSTLRPSSKHGAEIFDDSGLKAQDLSTTIVPVSSSRMMSPSKTPPKDTGRITLEMTPVKSDAFGAEHELELVSPSKKLNIQNIVRSLENDDDEEEEEMGENRATKVVKFGKTESLERISPDVNPSSGYSSEPQPLSDQGQDSQGSLSSPEKEEEEPPKMTKKLSKELAGLNDLMSPYFSAEGSKRRVYSYSYNKQEKEVRLITGTNKRKRENVKTGEHSRKRKPSQGSETSESVKKTPSRRSSVRPMFYKEFESEESQTDEDELVRIVEERFGDAPEEMSPKRALPNLPSSGLVLQSPARFKCRLCGSKYRTRKALKDHEAKEEEAMRAENKVTLQPVKDNISDIREKAKPEEKSESVSDYEYEHEISTGKSKEETYKKQITDIKEKGKPEEKSETGSDLEYEHEISTGKSKEETSSKQITPKLVANLQDQLSSYFSPSSSTEVRSRKSTDRLADSISHDMTPRSSKPQSRSLLRTRTLLQGTSTPNEGEMTSSSRSRRKVSYAEFPDFDSTGSDTSFNDSSRMIKSSSVTKRFLLASVKRASISPNTSISSLNGSRKVVVKDLNDSQEIVDIGASKSVAKKTKSKPPSPVKTPEKSSSAPVNVSISSPGKFQSIFSVTERTETPTGQIKLRINRTSKPQQSSTPLTSSKRTGVKEPSLRSLIIPRLNRSACKEMGLSPNKLVSILTSKTPQKTGDGDLLTPDSVITPEKENEPLDTCSKLRRENDINKTPRIRIKRVPSKQGSEAAPNWEVQRILSPQKTASPLKRPAVIMESPARTFSPLTSRSLHQLTTSPIINTQVQVQVQDRRKKKGRVNKQLAYI